MLMKLSADEEMPSEVRSLQIYRVYSWSIFLCGLHPILSSVLTILMS